MAHVTSNPKLGGFKPSGCVDAAGTFVFHPYLAVSVNWEFFKAV